MDERQLLLSDIDKEEQAAIEAAAHWEAKIQHWKERHTDGLQGYEFKKALAEKRLKEIKESRERAKHDPQPSLALALKNEEKARNGKLRFEKVTLYFPHEIAHRLGIVEPILVRKLSVKKIQSGERAGKSFVNHFTAQLIYNTLVSLATFRHVTEEEVLEALNKLVSK